MTEIKFDMYYKLSTGHFVTRFPQVWNCMEWTSELFTEESSRNTPKKKRRRIRERLVRGQQIPEFEVSCKSDAP